MGVSINKAVQLLERNCLRKFSTLKYSNLPKYLKTQIPKYLDLPKYLNTQIPKFTQIPKVWLLLGRKVLNEIYKVRIVLFQLRRHDSSSNGFSSKTYAEKGTLIKSKLNFAYDRYDSYIHKCYHPLINSNKFIYSSLFIILFKLKQLLEIIYLLASFQFYFIFFILLETIWSQHKIFV